MPHPCEVVTRALKLFETKIPVKVSQFTSLVEIPTILTMYIVYHIVINFWYPPSLANKVYSNKGRIRHSAS